MHPVAEHVIQACHQHCAARRHAIQQVAATGETEVLKGQSVCRREQIRVCRKHLTAGFDAVPIGAVWHNTEMEADLDFSLCSFAIVQLEQITGLEVNSCCAVWMLLKICLQDLRAHVKVIQLAVAQCNVHIESNVVSIFQQQLFVYVCGFLHYTCAGKNTFEQQWVASCECCLYLQMGNTKSNSDERVDTVFCAIQSCLWC